MKLAFELEEFGFRIALKIINKPKEIERFCNFARTWSVPSSLCRAADIGRRIMN